MPPPFLLHTTYADTCTCIVNYFKAKTKEKKTQKELLVSCNQTLGCLCKTPSFTETAERLKKIQ